MRTVMGMAVTAALLLGTVGAGPAHAKAAAKAAAPTCPACKMTLATKKSKANPKAVKIGGKTYFCCAKCDMDKAKAKK